MTTSNKSAKNQSVRELIRRVMRIITVRDGDVLALRAGSPLANMDNVKKLSRAFASTGRRNVIVIVVEDFGDLTVLDEARMNELGWYRERV